MSWQKQEQCWTKDLCASHQKEKMSQFEKFVTEGNDEADDLAKTGAMLDEGFMAEARAKTMQQDT